MASQEYIWACCNCFSDCMHTFSPSCVSCCHLRCSYCEVRVVSAKTPRPAGISTWCPSDGESIAARQESPNQRASVHQTPVAMPPLDSDRELGGSHISEPRSDRMNIDSLGSSLDEEANEEHRKMGEDLNSGLHPRYNTEVQGAATETSSLENVPQPALSSNETSRTDHEDPPGAIGEREDGGKSENDLTSSEANSPTYSEDFSSTLSYRERDDESPEVMGGLDVEDAEEETSNIDTSSLAGTSGEDLLELPWFHRNVRRVLHRVLQQWQGTRTATSYRSGAQPAISVNQGLEFQEQQGPGGVKRRNEADVDDGVDRGNLSSGRLKRARRPTGSGSSRPFSCPFCKKDLQRYQACVRYELTKVRHVKQHLRRKHTDEIDEPERHSLKKRSPPGTEEEQWYGIFDLLFPGHSPRPASPYNDFTVFERPQSSQDGLPIDEALYIPGMLLTGEFLQTLQQSLIQDPAFANIGAVEIQRALERGLSQAYAEQISQQNGPFDPLQPRDQQGSEGGNENSEERSDNRDSTLGQDLSDAHSSDDHEALQAQLESMPDPERPQHEIDEMRRWEDLLQHENLTVGGGTQDQQLSLDSQTGPTDGQELGLSFSEDERPPGSAWGHLFDANWGLDEWTDIDFAQSFGESSGAKV